MGLSLLVNRVVFPRRGSAPDLEGVVPETGDAGGRRHRWLKTAFLSGALGVSAVAVAVGMSGPPTGAIGAGKAELSTSHPGPLFRSQLVPGESAEANVDVSNTGAVPVDVQLRRSIDATGSKSLASILHLVVVDCGRLGSSQRCGIGRTRLFSGNLEQMAPIPLGTYGCQEGHRYEITTRLPGWAGNRFQHALAKWDLDWSAVPTPSASSCSELQL